MGTSKFKIDVPEELSRSGEIPPREDNAGGAHGKLLPKLGFALIVAAIAVLGVIVSNLLSPNSLSPDKWQAVFLNNGQVYFGHLNRVGEDYLELRNVYYLRIAQALQPPSSTAPAFDLVKLGGELHGPEDQIYFLKPSILFWESMKSDSQVVRAINNFQQTRK